jgi:hypothetical protein
LRWPRRDRECVLEVPGDHHGRTTQPVALDLAPELGQRDGDEQPERRNDDRSSIMVKPLLRTSICAAWF